MEWEKRLMPHQSSTQLLQFEACFLSSCYCSQIWHVFIVCSYWFWGLISCCLAQNHQICSRQQRKKGLFNISVRPWNLDHWVDSSGCWIYWFLVKDLLNHGSWFTSLQILRNLLWMCVNQWISRATSERGNPRTRGSTFLPSCPSFDNLLRCPIWRRIGIRIRP